MIDDEREKSDMSDDERALHPSHNLSKVKHHGSINAFHRALALKITSLNPFKQEKNRYNQYRNEKHL